MQVCFCEHQVAAGVGSMPCINLRTALPPETVQMGMAMQLEKAVERLVRNKGNGMPQ